MQYRLWLLIGFLSACVNQTEETASDSRTKITSQIQPRPLFIAGKSRAETLKPAPLQSIGSPQTFYFSTGGTPYGSVLIFNTDVGVTAAEFAAGRLAGKCIAGASNLAGHTWNGATLNLDNGSASDFYVCDASNPTDPLSQTVKFSRSSLAPSTTYYWLVIGYDSTKAASHTSGLEKFSTP